MKVRELNLNLIKTGFPAPVIYVLEVGLLVNENTSITLSITYDRGDGDTVLLRDKLLELIDLIEEQERRFES